MSYRGGGRGFQQDRRGGRGGSWNRGRGLGRFGGGQKGVGEADPPDRVEMIGQYLHSCENKLIYEFLKAVHVPRFNSFVYTESKKKIGKIDEVFGATERIMFSVIPEVGIVPESVKKGATISMSPFQMTPLFKFTNPHPPGSHGKRGARSQSDRGGMNQSRKFGRGRGRR
mmetsp:Transcript_7105/g.10741  ORF Transcript_7105/g.10741 Transcript_7105/m.10741 type:complete len:170 (-) Transcript_7105:67-576(-)